MYFRSSSAPFLSRFSKCMCYVVSTFIFSLFFYWQFEDGERKRQQGDLQKMLARHQAEESELKNGSDNELIELKQLQVSSFSLYEQSVVSGVIEGINK